MPNWCSNKVEIILTGYNKNNPDDVNYMKRLICASQADKINAKRICNPEKAPYSNDVESVWTEYTCPPAGGNKGDGHRPIDINALPPIDGLLEFLAPVSDKTYMGYLEAWGTKWDTHDAFLSCSDEEALDTGSLSLEFLTAWSPPTEAFRTAVKLNPRLWIDIVYFEPSMCFAGEAFFDHNSECAVAVDLPMTREEADDFSQDAIDYLESSFEGFMSSLYEGASDDETPSTEDK